jgi:beta-glucosidase
MREMGLGGYRFSIAWPRIFPEGKGQVNPPGLDFYDRLVDGLLGAGITPFVTLYHWDLPQALQDTGGWANRDTAPLFAAYADTVLRRLGDRVTNWITMNEPAIIAHLGNLWGFHAPGKRDLRTTYAVAHHVLLAHGLAVQSMRSARPGLTLGITLDLVPAQPASDRAEDIDATQVFDGFKNRWFLDPVFKGKYPEDIASLLGDAAPPVQEGDLAIISTPVDFLGINYYTRHLIRRSDGNAPFHYEQVSPVGSEYTDTGWEVYPDGLREILERVHRDYAAPAYYVTENGCAQPDVLEPDGAVHDTRRQAYLESHFEAMSNAISAGVPLKGYFVWSLMDNFEWAMGYTKRFGIVYVDYPTERRIWKDSARWYQRWIGAHS